MMSGLLDILEAVKSERGSGIVQPDWVRETDSHPLICNYNLVGLALQVHHPCSGTLPFRALRDNLFCRTNRGWWNTDPQSRPWKWAMGTDLPALARPEFPSPSRRGHGCPHEVQIGCLTRPRRHMFGGTPVGAFQVRSPVFVRIK